MRSSAVLLSLALLLAVSCAGRKETLRPERAEQIITHQVQYGETWVTIAEDFYGDDSRAGDLALYNGVDQERLPEPGGGTSLLKAITWPSLLLTSLQRWARSPTVPVSKLSARRTAGSASMPMSPG